MVIYLVKIPKKILNGNISGENSKKKFKKNIKYLWDLPEKN
jgi:hypothetical protein